MGFWLMLVGGLQGGFGHWGTVDDARESRMYGLKPVVIDALFIS